MSACGRRKFNIGPRKCSSPMSIMGREIILRGPCQHWATKIFAAHVDNGPRKFISWPMSIWGDEKFCRPHVLFFIFWATTYNFVAHAIIGRRKISPPIFPYSWKYFWVHFPVPVVCFGQHFCICALFQLHIFLSLLNAYQGHLFLASFYNTNTLC